MTTRHCPYGYDCQDWTKPSGRERYCEGCWDDLVGRADFERKAQREDREDAGKTP